MNLGLLLVYVVLAVAAGLFVGSAAARQLEAAPEERESLSKKARKAATKRAMRWFFRRRANDE